MALVISSVEASKKLTQLSKYAVFFFYDSRKMSTSKFREEFIPLLRLVRRNPNFKCGQFDKTKVPIPTEKFGFASDKGVIIYVNGIYHTYMTDFNLAEFQRIVSSPESVPMARV
ncbi:hypothetical protein GGI25_001989 [Coemansia spiralis]|uniref:Uncharacterized protein n=2 Tax=Coemansia TaxID=4863 RepID=A0A9W8G9R4_9FUNG|nr:hypothetical protein BX070DRAFT_227871 [Coemansia spiralis]KAJ1986675.1 hypothetical protein EDC05_006209 [Coemansia umbellata]KAJ2623245.1 hypothetical protein GGI26_002472 [Coemansia sp. RSA 1358]KAJ2678797.1 hypothetical protein GGI25_001989 [Coemansia spiralis]